MRAPDVAAAVARLQAAGRSTMTVRHGDRWLGTLGVADRPRAGIRDVLDELRGLGIKPLVMLTGDNRGVGNAIGAEVGVDEVRADLLPEDKVTAVQDLLREYGLVAMVPDELPLSQTATKRPVESASIFRRFWLPNV